MEETFKRFFERFYYIQVEKYFDSSRKETFETEAEEAKILQTIREGWNKYIDSNRNKLLTMSERDIGNLFEAVELEFPQYIHTKDDTISFNDNDDEDFEDLINSDDVFLDDEDDDELEFLEEELNRLSDELNEIPEDEREDVVMLMLAFPALQEIGFPVEVFMGGDGSTHLTDKQRQQIDWARQLAYKIVDMVEESDPQQKALLHKEITAFASAFVPPTKIEKIVIDIKTAYERGKRY